MHSLHWLTPLSVCQAAALVLCDDELALNVHITATTRVLGEGGFTSLPPRKRKRKRKWDGSELNRSSPARLLDGRRRLRARFSRGGSYISTSCSSTAFAPSSQISTLHSLPKVASRLPRPSPQMANGWENGRTRTTQRLNLHRRQQCCASPLERYRNIHGQLLE